MSNGVIEEVDQAAAIYDASFSSGLSKGAQRYLAVWMSKNKPVYAERWKRAITSFRRAYAKPPIMDVCELYCKLQANAERTRNREYCEHCHNMGHGVYLRVTVGKRALPVRRDGTYAVEREGMWRYEKVTADHSISQGLVPCTCPQGKEARQESKMSTGVIDYLQRHCWLKMEDANRLEDSLFAEARAANLVEFDKRGSEKRPEQAIPFLDPHQAQDAAQQLEAAR